MIIKSSYVILLLVSIIKSIEKNPHGSFYWTKKYFQEQVIRFDLHITLFKDKLLHYDTNLTLKVTWSRSIQETTTKRQVD
jgi:hypothetical protein